jgi:hypothetical protein
MQLDFCPRAHLRERLLAGWRLVPGHEYKPSDYAILLMLPDIKSKVTAKWINAVVLRFEPHRDDFPSNKARARVSVLEARRQSCTP